MSNRIFHVWTPPAIVLLVASLCAVTGYGIGLAVTLKLAQNSLFKYAAQNSFDFERPADEGHQLLSEINASPYRRCSEEDLDYLRLLILKSRFVKDVGHMMGSQLECSAILSRAQLPSTEYLPSFRRKDGTSIYIKVEALQMGGLIPIVMRMGDAYAAIDPYNRNMMPPGVQFTVTSKMSEQGTSGYIGGSHTDLTPDVLTRDTSGRIHGILYATHCSSKYLSCLTLYLPLREVVRAQRSQILLCAVAGGILGGCFGLMSLIIYKRKKGIEQQLRRAIRRNELQLVYQPLVDLFTRKVTGAEALVRWTDEEKLVIPPEVFIKIAEERGFVGQITKLVIRRVMVDFGQYLRDHPEFRININIAVSDLNDPAFQPMLERALSEAELAPHSFGIEITEGATARHTEAIKMIAQLRHSGHEVYIDDFGTGYSSLAYLKDLGVDGIKIDRAFTLAIDTESVTVGILPQIMAMARALNLKIVAEGIETEAQYAYYTAMGCSLTAQGWLFGHPVGPEEFELRHLKQIGQQPH